MYISLNQNIKAYVFGARFLCDKSRKNITMLLFILRVSPVTWNILSSGIPISLKET